MPKLTALEAHNQLREVLPGEEIVTLNSSKGDSATYKLNHKHKQVLIAGGPEEDCAFKHTNASYDSVLAHLGRSADNSQPVFESTPVDLESVAPSVEV